MICIGNHVHGTLIARAAQTCFDPNVDVCISRIDSAHNFLGGFILTNYTGSMMTDHMAGVGAWWCSPQLMWMIFDYQFEQLGLKKVLATVSSNNHQAMKLVHRAGFELEYSIRDGVPDGKLMLFSMSRDRCKWLRLRSRYARLNGSHRGEHVHAQA